MGQSSLTLRTTLGFFGAILTLAAASPAGSAQTTDVKPMDSRVHPSFEVASIKQSDPDDHSKGFHAIGRNIFIENETMNDLIAAAYNVHVKQIADGPSWFSSQRFDIKGFPDVDGEPNVEQLREMIRTLLTERYHLQVRREQREMPRFTLTVAKGGPKMGATKSAPEDGLPDQTGGIDSGHVFWRFTNNSMTDFAEFLQSVLDRPVVDATGLKGKYDFKLQWTADADATTDPSAAPGFFTAIQEQTGLKVEPSRGAVEVLAVVHVEQPSAN